MKIEYYKKFEDELNKGLKKQAASSVKKFVESFENVNEIQAWVWEYLSELPKDSYGNIRHELFTGLIYPVLKDGYDRTDLECTLWLGKLIQNVYKDKNIHKELGYPSDLLLYRKCYEIDPENHENNGYLLRSIFSWLSHCEHEWPSGILYGMDGATLEQCKEIREEVAFARSLTDSKSDLDYLEQFLEKLAEYEKRLNKNEN